MTRQLKLTSLLLLVASFSFAQTIVNTMESNKKDRVVIDTKKPATTSEQAKSVPTLPGIGVVIKKNPGSGAGRAITTKNDGTFETKLEEGSYTISIYAAQLKKAITPLKRKDEKINGATFVFELPANFTFSGTEKPNKNGEYVAPNYEFNITVPKEGTLLAGKLLTTSTAGLSITPTVNEKGTGQPKGAGF